MPAKAHAEERVPACAGLEQTDEQGRHAPVPEEAREPRQLRGQGVRRSCWCPGKACRADREDAHLRIHSDDLMRELVVHPVTWGRKGGFREGRCAGVRPAELPTAQVKATIARLGPTPTKPGSEKLGLGRRA